jgi:hypothetical protein
VLTSGVLGLPAPACAADPAASGATTPAASAAPAGAQPAATGQQAAPSGSTARAALPPLYNVFIPIDKQDRPTGDKYYLSEDLYNDLHRRAAAVTDEPQGWLLGSAAYRGVLAWQAASDRLVLNELRASFELVVFGAGARVRIPLKREGASLLPDGATLDGRVVQAEWQQDGTVLSLEAAEPGQYHLELSLLPAMRSGATQGGFDLSIPRLATSRLELSIPPDAPVIEVPSAVGRTVYEGDPARVVAELGAADRLSVRWPDGASRGSAEPAVDLEQYLWLKVQPGSVRLDTRLKLHLVEGRIREFLVAADPRLRLLPLAADSPVAQVPIMPGAPQILRFELTRPASDQVTVDASFLLTGTSGVGNLGLPRLEVLNVRTTKRWMAVSVDPSLEHEIQASNRLEALTGQAFTTAWSAAGAPPPAASPAPLAAYSLASGEPAWSLATRPREPRTVVDQVLSLDFDLDRAEVHYQGRLVTQAGDSFRYQMVAPAELEVEKVSLLVDAVERVARWSRGPQGALNVFLNGPASGQQSLTIRGHLPLADPKNVPLPVIRVEGAELHSGLIRLLRRPAVQVKISQTAGLKAVEAPAVDDKPAAGRPVGSFQVNQKTYRATLSVWPNHPELRARQTTILRFDGEQREAKVEFQIDVEHGLVDELSLRVPPEWSGPYEVDPPAAIRVQQAGKGDSPPLCEAPGGRAPTEGWSRQMGTVPFSRTGETQRRLVVEPPASITGRYHLVITGPLVVPSGQRVRVPEILLEDARLDRHVLILPTQAQLHPVAWDVQGLKEIPLPEDFSAPPVARESFVAYQVDGPSFHGVLRPLSGVAQTHLADVSLAWLADGGYTAVALLDVETAGRRESTLRMPEGSRLVAVRVAGVPASPEAAGRNRWKLTFFPSGLPQRVEVVFDGALASADVLGSRRFESPTLEDHPVRQTLWTISGPPSLWPGKAVGVRPIDRLEQDLIRLRSLTTMLKGAEDFSGEERGQPNSWRARWSGRWSAARDAVGRWLVLGDSVDRRESVKRELSVLEGSVAWVAKNRPARRDAETRGRGDAGSAGTSAADNPPALWQYCLDRPDDTTRCLAADGAASVVLDYQARALDSWWGRFFAACGLGLLAAACLLGSLRGVSLAFFSRWPHVLGVVAGLAWWLWLWPSALGWLVILATLACSIRSGWKWSRPRSNQNPLAARTSWK